jgi:2-keto-4-pentenoate hydratase/2-oxohepta-3-ene-1,7-dioic acid hydratase in catechol pathway
MWSDGRGANCRGFLNAQMATLPTVRWATFLDAVGRERTGVVVGDDLHALPRETRLLDLLGDGGDRLADAGAKATANPDDVVPIQSARLLPPITRPPSIRDFYAFEQHVRTARQRRGLEMDPDWYELPVFYFSNPAAIVGPFEDVAVPPGTAALDFELEVAAIVGRGGADLDPEEAERTIVGYCVMNDWSARDIQRREMKLSMGPVKGKDFATTLGPFLVTADEVEPFRKGRAFDLAMVARVNGKEYSRASLAEIYWSFGEMIAYASRGTQVVPGDVIGSGTCGTGCILELSLVHGEDRFPWLQPGDLVELEVEHLGRIANRVVPGRPLKPLRSPR